MPVRIPNYQQQTSIQDGAPIPTAPLAVPTSTLGQSIGQVAQAVTQYAEAQQIVQKDAASTEAARVTSQVGLQLNQAKNDAISNAQAGGYGLTQGFQQSFDKIRTDTLQGVTDPYALKTLNLYFDHQQATYGVAMQDAENNMRTKYIAQNLGDASDNVTRTIAQDPTQYTAALAPLLGTVNGIAGIDGNMKQALVTKFTQEAAFAAGARISQDNPSGFISAFQTPADKPMPAGYEWMRSVEPQKLNVLQNHAQALWLQQQNAADAAALQRENAGVDAYNQALSLVNDGKQLSLPYQTTLLASTNGTAVAGQTQELIQQASRNAGFASMPLPQQRASIQADQSAAATPGVGTDPATAAAVAARQKIYTASVEAYKTDPWNAALDRGVIQQIPQVDTSSVGSLMNSLSARVSAAGAVENAAGRRVSLLTPDESTQVFKQVQALPIDQKAQVLDSLGGVFGQAARINDLAQQWKEKDPAVALALKAGAGGGNGNPLMTMSGAPVSAFILQGEQALKDKTVKVDEGAGTGLKAQIANAIDGALPPQQADDAKEMAWYIAAGSAARANRSGGIPTSADIQNGINSATGGISTTGGLRPNGDANRVAMPYGWHEDDFQNSVKSATAENIENTVGGKPVDMVYANGTPIPVADFMAKFPSYQLVRVGVRGTYAVSTGSKFVTDSSGAPINVHLSLAQKGAQGAPVATAPTTSSDPTYTPTF
ncbi:MULTISPECIES: hypothetical protein [unclassified Paraburkholderia]|uniref:hypothetical protein n=1 Tax=unclassified Paraburkholderia TaxID=2615204 RepID=UPI002AAFD6DA|nr:MULTISPECIES: hypothetical protein [unclassified Paraburkholderia]